MDLGELVLAQTWGAKRALRRVIVMHDLGNRTFFGEMFAA